MATFVDPATLAVAAVTAAGVAGASLGASWARVREASSRRRHLRRTAGIERGSPQPAEGIDGRALGYAVALSRRISLGAASPVLGRSFASRAARFLESHAGKVGLDSALTPIGFAEASTRLAAFAAGAGALVGAVLSNELAVAACAGGAVWGAFCLPRAVRKAERVRAVQLERDLSEMLETVSLGLRSGLAFDRSFELYGEHFDSIFARECAAARRAWTFGLATREDALRTLAASYDSPLLARVVESTVRALRFGSSLAETLESAAAEARAVHRAQVEERVAKAPVKMMVPTGTLILPAMLLLVLGPVLLELMEGF